MILTGLALSCHSLVSFAQAQAPATGKPQGPAQTVSFFLPLALVCGIFYFMLIRPQQKQAKQRQSMISALQKGDTVITTGGIYGRVTGIADNILTLEIADNCKIKIERNAIQTVTTVNKEGKAA